MGVKSAGLSCLRHGHQWVSQCTPNGRAKMRRNRGAQSPFNQSSSLSTSTPIFNHQQATNFVRTRGVFELSEPCRADRKTGCELNEDAPLTDCVMKARPLLRLVLLSFLFRKHKVFVEAEPEPVRQPSAHHSNISQQCSKRRAQHLELVDDANVARIYVMDVSTLI